MKAPIRSIVLASVLSLSVAAPVFADAPTVTHESLSTCRTDDATGLTSCFASEATIRTKEMKSGETRVRILGTIYATVVDADGNLVSSVESTSSERNTVLVSEEGSQLFIDQNVRREDEVMTDGTTTCTRYRVLITNETERINKVSTAPGPC